MSPEYPKDMKNVTLPVMLLLTLGTGLTACTLQPSARINHGLSASERNLIVGIVPDRGEGATYREGEAVQLKVDVREAGYLTLVARRPDGSAQILVRDAHVERGLTVFPRPADSVTYNVALPEGRQVIRAIFNRERPATDLVISGIYDQNRWNAVGYNDFQPVKMADRDVQETYFQIVR